MATLLSFQYYNLPESYLNLVDNTDSCFFGYQGQKSLALDTAIGMWQLLFAEKHWPLADHWCQFLQVILLILSILQLMIYSFICLLLLPVAGSCTGIYLLCSMQLLLICEDVLLVGNLLRSVSPNPFYPFSWKFSDSGSS